MFDFNNITKVFQYDYKNIFERITPKDNKEVMKKDMIDNIMSGAILKVVSDVFMMVATIVIAFFLSHLSEDLFGGVNLFGIRQNVSFSVVFPISIPIAIIVYLALMKEKEQSSLMHFIVLIYCAVNTLTSIFSLITWFASMFINPFAAAIGLFALVLSVVGNLFIIVGCLDFCCMTKEKYVATHTIKPKKADIKTQPIAVDEVSLHTNKFCANCGNKLGENDKFCKECGTKRA